MIHKRKKNATYIDCFHFHKNNFRNSRSLIKNYFYLTSRDGYCLVVIHD